MHQPHTEEERWDRHKTREAFARFAEVKQRGPHDPDYERLRSELVVAHLNLVRYLAVKFANRGESLDDLIQVGTVGLLKAIDRFDLERGVEFTTYATPTIVGEIKRYFRDKGWAVKVPRRLQELNLAVNRAIEKLSVKMGRSPTVAELAEHLNASEEDILEAQELGQAYNLLSLDTELSGEGDKKAQTLADYIGTTDAGLALLDECAAAVTSQPGRARFSGPARCANRSGRCTPWAAASLARRGSAPISRRTPWRRARTPSFRAWAAASGAPNARNTTALPRGSRTTAAAMSGVLAGSVKKSSGGRPFRSPARRFMSAAVRLRVQKLAEMAEPSHNADGYHAVVARIARAAQACGRDPADVTLVAVSKTQPWEAVAPVLAAGQRVFGENRVQEAAARWSDRGDTGVQLHLIGPLQTNKVKEAVALFDAIETVDREKLARVLAEAMDRQGRRPRLYVQVNTGEEPQKAGVVPGEADAFVTLCRRTYGLEPDGLMCIPPLGEPAGPHFALLAAIAARNGLAKLSMGMSDDFETAIRFGATSVRVGSAIFGARPAA